MAPPYPSLPNQLPINYENYFDYPIPELPFYEFEDQPEEQPQYEPFGPQVYHTTWTIEIDNQNDLPKTLFRYLKSKSESRLKLTQDTFIQMWKTIIFHRALKLCEPGSFHFQTIEIKLREDLLIPSPLFDLVSRIGPYFHVERFERHHILAPYASYPLKRYQTLDPKIQEDWQHDMLKCKRFYNIQEYRLPPDTDENYLTVVLRGPVIPPVLNSTEIRSYSDEATPLDATVVLVNNELFSPTYSYSYEDAPYHLDPVTSISDARHNYVTGYTLPNIQS